MYIYIGWGSLTMEFTGKFVYMGYLLSCYGSTPSTLGLIGRDGDSRTLCHNCIVAGLLVSRGC